jgi:hypothetical protein
MDLKKRVFLGHIHPVSLELLLLYGSLSAPLLHLQVQYVQFSTSVGGPDPDVVGPPGSGSVSTRYRPGSGFLSRSLYHQAKIEKTLHSSCFVTSL